MSVRSSRLVCLVVLLATLGVTACGSDGASGTAPNGIVVDVDAVDDLFVPESIEIAAGTEVHWVNTGERAHNIRPDDDGQDWGVEIAEFLPGEEYSHVFGEPGTFPYFCSLHVGMVGTIVVQPASGS